MTADPDQNLRRSGRPTDFAITLIAVQPQYANDGGWLYSDEVRGRLRWLGFDVTGQFVTARLNAMCREDAPRFERRDSYGREKQYRVMQWGRNEINNKMPGLGRV